MMGLNVLNSRLLQQQAAVIAIPGCGLHREFLRDQRYMTLAVLGALVQSINTTIVVSVQHPTCLQHARRSSRKPDGFLILTICMPKKTEKNYSYTDDP